jgi:5'-phosphate synthase pdxT subunit
VLSLQGDFARHQAVLEALGVGAPRVTRADDLEPLAGLVIPGGESSTMLHLIESGGMRAALEDFARRRPVLGTCAGLILLGRGADQLPAKPLGALDVEVARNAYGRQIDSFGAEVESPAVGGSYHAIFIRAPRITRVGPGVEVVARRAPAHGGEPVGVRQGGLVGLCFHPELTADLRFHRWFLGEVAGVSPPGTSAAAPLARSAPAGPRAVP